MAEIEETEDKQPPLPDEEPEPSIVAPPTITVRLIGVQFHISFDGSFPIPMIFAVTKLLERFANSQLEQQEMQQAQELMMRNKIMADIGRGH